MSSRKQSLEERHIRAYARHYEVILQRRYSDGWFGYWVSGIPGSQWNYIWPGVPTVDQINAVALALLPIAIESDEKYFQSDYLALTKAKLAILKASLNRSTDEP